MQRQNKEDIDQLKRFDWIGLNSCLLIVLALGLGGYQNDVLADQAGQANGQIVEKSEVKMGEAKEWVSTKFQEVGVYIDDAAITATIKADIIADPMLKVFQVSVTTTAGVVTLRGEVDSQASLDRLQAIASGVENVSSVQNELLVKAAE
ncbi:transporter [Thiocapsa imhoffii]|uniref:Transporter n=2 Tax=Thiocapsa imhoffii TaxID=382777 RepID=A0A9X0WKI3_9GAMM|nr:transporter [Thiocapsa imhoffii]